MLYSCSINSQRIVESVVLYKHSFRARKVVQMMDLRETREEKRALLLLGLDTLSKKRRKNRTSEKLHQKQLPLVVVVVVVKKREGKRERE